MLCGVWCCCVSGGVVVGVAILCLCFGVVILCCNFVMFCADSDGPSKSGITSKPLFPTSSR